MCIYIYHILRFLHTWMRLKPSTAFCHCSCPFFGRHSWKSGQVESVLSWLEISVKLWLQRTLFNYQPLLKEPQMAGFCSVKKHRSMNLGDSWWRRFFLTIFVVFVVIFCWKGQVWWWISAWWWFSRMFFNSIVN